MSKVYTSAAVIIPPKEKWKPIQEIRQIYDRNFNRWMPHITLLYPFRPKNAYSKLEEEFTEACSQIKSFELSLKRFNFFHHSHQNYTIWLDPEPINLIIQLQSTIIKIVPDCNDVNKFKNGFQPHLSVGQIKGKNKLRDTIANLNGRWEDLKFLVREIYFIAREKNKYSKFEIEKQFPLSK